MRAGNPMVSQIGLKLIVYLRYYGNEKHIYCCCLCNRSLSDVWFALNGIISKGSDVNVNG